MQQSVLDQFTEVTMRDVHCAGQIWRGGGKFAGWGKLLTSLSANKMITGISFSFFFSFAMTLIKIMRRGIKSLLAKSHSD